MPQAKITEHGLATTVTSPVGEDEFHKVVDSLADVKVTDLGDITTFVGVNAAGALVVCINTMAGTHAIVSVIRLLS